MRDVGQIWVYLSASPLLHLTLTLVVYQLSTMLYRRGRLNPLLNPVMLSIVAIVAILALTGTRYQTYFDGAQFVHFLLGPATVALAIPLYRQERQFARVGIALTRGTMSGWLMKLAAACGRLGCRRPAGGRTRITASAAAISAS